MRWTNSLGTVGVVRPRKSLICVEAMSRAMPFVNPMVTGRGMYLTAAPRPVNPHNEQQNASHDPHQRETGGSEPGNDAGHDDDNSASGPADLGARTAQGRDEEAGDDGSVKPGLRRDAGSNGEGHGQRQRHQSHRETCDEIVRKLLRFVALQTLKGAGKPPVS